MGFNLVLPLRIAQFIFAIIVAGLAGYVFHWYDVRTVTDPPSQINFMIAVPIFSLISILYLEITSRFLPKLSHPYVQLGFNLLNTIFYFCGFVALAVFLSKLLFCQGKVCASARSATVFGAFAFALWAATSTILLLDIFKGGVAGVKTDRKAEKAMKLEREHGKTATVAV